ncbi:MAG: hypothetical protein GF418_07500 [Chitinivibrionales bacterium]|nr:hypothetical protein [Chitinivibrionales bacterium]MBD3395457.1 hypothetical protein [Chitinivibrionales bacterium]
MEHTYHGLKGKTVAELREIAKGIEHEAVEGATQMNKEHLLDAICKALNIDTREHHVATGIDKKGIKSKIADLKTQRDGMLEKKDYAKLKTVRRRIHRLKHKLRRAAA